MIVLLRDKYCPELWNGIVYKPLNESGFSADTDRHGNENALWRWFALLASIA